MKRGEQGEAPFAGLKVQVDRARARTRIRAEHPVRDEHPLSWLRLEEMPAGKLTRGQWTKEQAFIVRLGASSISFLSAQPDSHIVGATASLLLEADEAQDIDPRKWDRDLVPMGSSVAAIRVLYGTPGAGVQRAPCALANPLLLVEGCPLA